MADKLTNYVSSRLDCEDAPMVLKCVPYGRLEDVSAHFFGSRQGLTLEQVMPYLGRRAIENKSVLG
jgi:proline dehydrogenase